MDLNRYKSLNDLLFKQDFQNTVQGVHALNSAKNSLRDLIEKQWRHFIATLPTTEKEQLGIFIRCVKKHGMKLDFVDINNEDLGCGHKNCDLLYIRLRKLSYVTGDISAEQDMECLLQEKQHNFSNTDYCFSFIWDLAHCFIGVKTQDVKLQGREMNAKTLIKLMKSCRMFAFKDSEKIYGQVLEDIDKLIYAKDLLISKEDRDMLFDHLLVLLRRWQQNCQSCAYGVEDIKKMQQDYADCEIFEYQFLVKNVLEIIKNMLEDNESESDLPATINSNGVSSSKELISSLLLQVEEMISVQEPNELIYLNQQDDSLEKEHITLKMERIIEKTSLAQFMNEVSETKQENKRLKEKNLKLQKEIDQMKSFKDEEIRKNKELQLKLKTPETDLDIQAAMENNQEDHLHKQAGMDKTKMHLFQSKAEGKQPSQNETMIDTGKSTFSTRIRPLQSPGPPIENDEQLSKPLNISSSAPESPKGAEKKAMTTIESRTSPSQESPNGTEEGTPTSNKSSGWSLNDLEVFKYPMCLISAKRETNEDGEEDKIILKSEQDVFAQLKQIYLPLVIIAVVGLYRSGKSYLMNCLANSFKGGFALGNNIQAETKGIWVWCKMHPKQKDTVLVLLDTEGLGDVEQDDENHDNNIFTLATLLCNCLVYNMKGAFDSEAVSKLTFVTEMAKNIRFHGKSSEDNHTLNLILPDFALCVRDFTLVLQKDGKAISEDEYLEESLAAKKGKAAKFNKPRECIRKYFPKRRCFVFPMPGDTYVIQKLEHLSFDDLCDSFRKATDIFVSYICDIQPKEMLGSKPINGEMFVTLAERYVTAIRHGAVPDVDDAFTAAAKIENAKIEKQAVEIFENQLVKVALPVPGNVLRDNYTSAQQAALKYLRENAVHDLKAECESQAQRKMDELWSTIKEDNDTKVKQMCEQRLQDDALKTCIEEKIKNKDYETAGGYRKFQRDVERLREDYVNNLLDFEENEILWTWHEFMKRIKETETRIVEADDNLSAKEKEDERRQNRENIEQLLKKQQKAQQEALDKQKADIEEHYKKLDEDREKQLKADQAKYEALLKGKLDIEAVKKEIKRYKKHKRERKDEPLPVRLWHAFWNDEDSDESDTS